MSLNRSESSGGLVTLSRAHRVFIDAAPPTLQVIFMRARRGGVERATVAAASIVLVLVVVLVSYFAVYNSGAIQSTGGVGYQPAQTSSQSTYSATSSAS